MAQKHCTYIFFAPPGSGKTTQHKRLFDYLKDSGGTPISINAGEIVREYFSNPKSDIEKLFKERMENGNLLPAAIPITLVTEKIIEDYKKGTSMILDGVARTKDEAVLLDEFLEFLDTCVYIIYLSVPKKYIIERLKKRGREDDNTAEKMQKRFQEYNKKTKKALKFFKKSKKITNFYKIDGTGTPEEVTNRIKKCICSN